MKVGVTFTKSVVVIILFLLLFLRRFRALISWLRVHQLLLLLQLVHFLWGIMMLCKLGQIFLSQTSLMLQRPLLRCGDLRHRAARLFSFFIWNVLQTLSSLVNKIQMI